MIFSEKQSRENFLGGRIWIQQRTFNPDEEVSLHTNDEDLIHKAQNGDFRSLEILHDRYRPSIYAYFYYRVDDVPAAEDLTSEVFVRTVEKIETFESHGRPFLAWLYAIANNLRVDHFRKISRQPLSELDESLPGMQQSSPLSSVEGRLWEECQRLVMKSIHCFIKRVQTSFLYSIFRIPSQWLHAFPVNFGLVEIKKGDCIQCVRT